MPGHVGERERERERERKLPRERYFVTLIKGSFPRLEDSRVLTLQRWKKALWKRIP